ncbi:hypothetical protein [Ferrimonas lipolytica]|uniref:Uncharacterized protein n=1 Tax=Ferrimonas lipolytica TaxID=2724191 RepID=A0A6H1UAA4_9GAMM|nr:hypothetical protein [Ferrimonas lipolytica]QIZ75758.1 hypothetical protein HER31_01885 [Ferrimonas lipolytica]
MDKKQDKDSEEKITVEEIAKSTTTYGLIQSMTQSKTLTIMVLVGLIIIISFIIFLSKQI